MRRSILTAWILLAFVFVLALAGVARRAPMLPEEGTESFTIPIQKKTGTMDSAVTIRVLLDETVEEMDLSDYLKGVLRAEMPATFEEEALKAQAVAARTETLYKMENGPVANHPQADICNDITCCQAYRTQAAAAETWGKNAQEYERRIAAAVEGTDGMVALYDGTPIFAAFFSAANGQTQNSGDVWSSDLPYLKSVSSPEDDETVPNYYSVATFSEAEFKSRFLAVYPAASFSGAAKEWIGGEERNDADMVLSIKIGGVSVPGTQVRKIYDLRSASFTVAAENGQIVFRVTGYGHGVGMSQYGANVLAREGKNYQEILTWYYSGITVAPYTPKQLANGS